MSLNGRHGDPCNKIVFLVKEMDELEMLWCCLTPSQFRPG